MLSEQLTGSITRISYDYIGSMSVLYEEAALTTLPARHPWCCVELLASSLFSEIIYRIASYPPYRG